VLWRQVSARAGAFGCNPVASVEARQYADAPAGFAGIPATAAHERLQESAGSTQRQPVSVPGCLQAAYRPHRAPTTFAGPTAVQGVGDGDETRLAPRIGIVTQRDDDFLARTEPFAQPRGGALEHRSAGYAEGLRQSRAKRRASRHDETRAAMSKAFVVGAGLMGAAVVAAAAFTILVFAGLFTVSSGVGRGHRPVTLVQQPPSTTTPPPSTTAPPPSPSDAIAPPSQSATTAPVSRSTAAQTGRARLPSSNRVATPRTAAGAQVPATPPESAPPAAAPAPALPPGSVPNLNPAGKAPPGHNK
jgi:hypothetical protein